MIEGYFITGFGAQRCYSLRIQPCVHRWISDETSSFVVVSSLIHQPFTADRRARSKHFYFQTGPMTWYSRLIMQSLFFRYSNPQLLTYHHLLSHLANQIEMLKITGALIAYFICKSYYMKLQTIIKSRHPGYATYKMIMYVCGITDDGMSTIIRNRLVNWATYALDRYGDK